MPNGFMTNWVTPWSLWPSKKMKFWKYGEIKWSFIIKSDYSKYSMLYRWRTNSFHKAFSWKTLLKLLEKWTTQIKLFHMLSVKDYWTSMKYHVYSFLFFSVCIKVCKNLWFNIKTDLWPKTMLLENSQLSLFKGKNWILMGNSYASTPQVRKALGIRMLNY